jgi:3D-(3,5/4)-trihydroxycyclohexane-1,2-dione acylhydrolase (decyclizing)
LQALAERLGIPVGETLAGKSAMRADGDLALGGLGVIGNPACGKIASEADVVICVGTRLNDFITGSHSLFQHPDVKFISINVNGHDGYKQGALPILADAREALSALDRATAGMRPDDAYLEEVGAVKRAWLDQVHSQVYQQIPNEAMSQGQVIGVLNESARAGDTIIAAAGSPPGDLHTLWNAANGKFCHLEFGNSCMGYEIPAALGVRMAQAKGGAEVYVLIGDGTYLMNPTELFTAVRERLKITVVVAENYGHQCIRNLQMNRTGESFGTEFKTRNAETARPDGEYVTLDFAENAASFGARTWSVSTPDQLCTALREARGETRPCVIVAAAEKHRLVPGSGVWWDVEAAESSENAVTRELREQYEADRKRLQRFYY